MAHQKLVEEILGQLAQNNLADQTGDQSRGPLKYVLQERLYPKEGLIVELGTGSGQKTRFIAGQVNGRTVHTFDWFHGCPSDWRPGFLRAYDDFKGRSPTGLPANVTVHNGRFEDKLGPFVERELRTAKENKKVARIALLYVDVDIYESTIIGLSALAPLITRGTVIVFDELVNYQGFEQHELKAFAEFLLKFKKQYRTIGMLGPIDFYKQPGSPRDFPRYQKAAFTIYEAKDKAAPQPVVQRVVPIDDPFPPPDNPPSPPPAVGCSTISTGTQSGGSQPG